MTDPSAPPHESGAIGIYVYGVVPSDTPPTVFADVRGVDAAQPVVLVGDDVLAAVTSGVPLAVFGHEALDAYLRDPEWLEEKIRAHDQVLGAAIGRTTVVPFRFGVIYENETRVRELLAERRDLVHVLARLADKVELGVNGYFDRDRFREQLAAERTAPGAEGATGRAYMERRRLERELETAVGDFAADVANAVHERLGAVAVDARVNALRPVSGDGSREMLLNGAYLVGASAVGDFRDVVDELGRRYAEEGVVLEVTGPWPPYNFAEATDE